MKLQVEGGHGSKGTLPAPARHLLGYAAWQTGDMTGTIESLKLSANHGFDEDWQLLIQAQISHEEALEENNNNQQSNHSNNNINNNSFSQTFSPESRRAWE